MSLYVIEIQPPVSGEYQCKRCGKTVKEIFDVTLSFDSKKQRLALCRECALLAKASVEKKNKELQNNQINKEHHEQKFDYAKQNKTLTVNSVKEDVKNAQKQHNQNATGNNSLPKDSIPKTFDIDDVSTYRQLNAEQKKIAQEYQSAIHSPLWNEGLNAIDIFRKANVSEEDLRTKIFVRFCDVSGYFWAEGPVAFSVPLDMFGYIKGKNVDEGESLYYSQRAIFTKYDNLNFTDIIDTVGKALLNWENKNLLTQTMGATTIYMRTNNEADLDRAMDILIDAAKLHHDKPNQNFYDCSSALWAMVALAIDFKNRYKRIATKRIEDLNNSAVQITPEDARKLRERTGAGMNDCKNALIEANGNMDEAEAILKRNGLSSYKKSNSNNAQPISKANQGNYSRPVSQNSKINNGSSSSQTQNVTQNSNNNNTAVNHTLRHFYDLSVQVVRGEEEMLHNSVYVYMVLFFKEFIEKYSNLKEIECVFAVLGIIGFDDEKGKYSRYSEKYNNNLEMCMDALASTMLKKYKNGYKDDPYINMCLATAALFCSSHFRSAEYERLKAVELLEKKGITINEMCGILWGILALEMDYYYFRNFSKSEVERFNIIYSQYDSSDNGANNNQNETYKNYNIGIEPKIEAKEFKAQFSAENENKKNNHYGCNTGNIVLLGSSGHGKSTLSAAIRKIYALKGLGDCVSVSDNNSFSYNNGQNTYNITECSGNTDAVSLTLKNMSEINCAILVISSTEGPTQQTKELLSLASQTGISNIAVFMSMADMADDAELLDMVEMEIRDMVADYGFNNNCVIVKGSSTQALSCNHFNIGSDSLKSVCDLMEATGID